MYKTCIIIIKYKPIYILCNKFQQSSSLRTKPFTFHVMIINGNGQEIQVCNILILNTKNVACLNCHVSCHLTKKNEISVLTQKMCKSHPKKYWRVGNSDNIKKKFWRVGNSDNIKTPRGLNQVPTH